MAWPTETRKVEASAEGLMQIAAFVEEYCEQSDQPKKATYRLLMICDELVSNIIKYAYPDGRGWIRVSLQLALPTENSDEVSGSEKDALLMIKFVDQGIPFNPLLADEADTTLPLSERPIGKLGITIVLDFAQSIEYKREDGNNILTIALKQR